MSVNIVVPELGESVVEATVLRWLKREGEPVAAGDVLVELETEKVNLEVTAERGGVLGRILHPEGDDVKIGDVLGVIETKEQPAEAAGAGPAAQPGRTAQPQEQPAAEGAPQPPRQLGEAEPPPKGAAGPVEETNPPGTFPEEVKATPVAKRYAEEYGVDLSRVPAHASDRRITRQDVEQYLHAKDQGRGAAPERTEPKPAAPPAAGDGRKLKEEEARAPAVPATTAARDGREERVHMSRRRQTIARRLVEAQHQAAMLTTFNEVDMSAVLDLRKRYREQFKERYGVGLGITSFFVRAAIGALKAFPRLNAEIDGDEMVLKHYYDIGIAVGAADGLVVPVLRDAERLSFIEIEKAIAEFANKAENNTLSLEDLRGGTFTITNGGVFGSLLSTPLLNPPQVGILGLHKIEERPVAHEGQVVVRPMMYVALSYDHRIVDGREAVQFLVRIKQLVEDPGALLLEA